MNNDGRKIILIDDDPFVLESVADLLTDYGFTVYPFNNGRAALERFRDEPVDVVLTDVKMPSMTGIELLKKVRAINQETPVILTTGFAEVEIAIEALKMGAFDFISKPFQFQHLLHAVEKGVQYKSMKLLEKNYRLELEQTVTRRPRS